MRCGLLRTVSLEPAGVSLEQQNVEFTHVQQGRARSHPYARPKVSSLWLVCLLLTGVERRKLATKKKKYVIILS